LKENQKHKATRGRVSSSKIDSLASVNKSYMSNLYSTNISFDEVTKEVKPACTSPGNVSNDFSPLPLRLKNYGGLLKKKIEDKGFEGFYQNLGEIVRKPKRNLDENSRG
jgi:hypothetical protein